MTVFTWLHLSDLHLGMRNASDFWPNVEDEFLGNLESLLQRSEVGPLDLVLFTGDLVQSGSPKEFEEVDALLEKFWQAFRERMNSDPKLLAVPGNHDLVRPASSTGANPDPALDTLMGLWDQPNIQDAFWRNRVSPQRQVVDEAFSNYVEWWGDTLLPKPEDYLAGELPGDFSATIHKDDAKLGIVGLNSTFLQLTDGVEKVDLNRRQFQIACGGHGPNWVNKHDVCLLLTHHPPAWLKGSEDERDLEVEIHSQGERFALHLFGHLHDAALAGLSRGGSKPRNRLQGRSLFGMEGRNIQDIERIHGYSVGQLRLEDDSAQLRIWPRMANRPGGGGWKFYPDNDSFDLSADDGHSIEPISITPRPRDKSSQNGVSPNGSSDTRRIEYSDPMRDPRKFQRLAQNTDNSRVKERLDQNPILIVRLDMLQQKLCRIEDWFESDLNNLRVKVELKDKLRGHLRAEVGKQLIALDKIHRQLRNSNSDDAVILPDAWQSITRIDHESQEKIFGECLEAIGGLAIRDKKLSARTSWVADTADEFIRECAREYVGEQWLSFAVPARHEALNRTMSRIVRLRFPEWTVWSLPLAAHEFGHVVIEDNTDWLEFAREHAPTLSWYTDRPEEQRSCMYEILADAIATYMMGPAYVCAAISLWLDPLPPSNDDDGTRCMTGPERARLMFHIMDQMQTTWSEEVADGETSTHHDLMEDELKRQWQVVAERVKSPDETPGDSETTTEELGGSDDDFSGEEQLTTLVGEVLQRFSAALEPRAPYLYAGDGGFEEAESWANGWLEQLKRGERPVAPRVFPESTLRNALNAAWLCRMQTKPYQFDAIADAAYELCKKIIRRRSIDAHESGEEAYLGPYVGRLPKQ